MITTMFLPQQDYPLYKEWLLRQDSETLKTYFGIPVTADFVYNLVSSICENADQHYFLVAFDHERWLGVLHIATQSDSNVEFGFIVDPDHRGQGIADRLMDEGITWAQNRRYSRLCLHCLSWNQPIQHLCKKYQLAIHTRDGDGDVNVELPPPSMISVGKEFASMNRNIFTRLLETSWSAAK
jgi:RimJ/RimL family protein N-acetyltransferase